MKPLVLIMGAVYGLTSVLLGALGAHAFKKFLSPMQLDSFETAVRYQMYHALVLLIIGFYFQFETAYEKAMGWMFIDGTFLFCISIYLLTFSPYWGINMKFLGPVTPIGGLIMIVGWAMLVYAIVKRF